MTVMKDSAQAMPAASCSGMQGSIPVDRFSSIDVGTFQEDSSVRSLSKARRHEVTRFMGHCIDAAVSHVQGSQAFACLSHHMVPRHGPHSAEQQSREAARDDSRRLEGTSCASTEQAQPSCRGKEGGKRRRHGRFASASDTAAAGDWKWPKFLQNLKPPK